VLHYFSHFDTCNGTISIVSSEFAQQGDDGLNVHGAFSLSGAVSGVTVTLVPPSQHGGAFLGTLHDTIEFRDRDSLQSLGTATLLGVSGSVLTFSALPPSFAAGDLLQSVSWMPSFYAVRAPRHVRCHCTQVL
jgi:hypothetical protein